MQNKGFVKVIAVLLTLICIFYLSFAFYTNYQDNKIEKLRATDPDAAEALLDSLNTEKCYLWAYTLKECRENAIGLGLDLKGGMNVMLEVSVPDVVRVLSDDNQSPAFTQAVSEAQKEAQESQTDFISLFIEKYKKLAGEEKLAAVFANSKMGDKVKTNSSDKDVEKVLRTEVESAIDNAFQVLRTRIDRFGVVQPNIQKIEGQTGRINVELPGIKEPERVRKLLQGSANLEFWETYDTQVALPYLSQINSALRGGTDAEEVKSDSTAATPAAVADTTATAQVKDTTAAVVAKADTAAKPDVLAKVDANAAADKEGDKK